MTLDLEERFARLEADNALLKQRLEAVELEIELERMRRNHHMKMRDEAEERGLINAAENERVRRLFAERLR